MTVIRRRLFWKVYLTLLSSLVAVAVLMGCLWWLLGENPRERWGAVRLHLTDQLAPSPDGPQGPAAEAVRRLGDEVEADISLYGRDGRLLAAHGPPIALRTVPGDDGPLGHHEMRIDLPDGRTVLARPAPPPGERVLRILTTMVVVAAGVGFVAFPMTARLTRQFERLRAAMARWGEGDLSARADVQGSDEVALVARTFNTAAERIDMLVTSQRALLANASHELRSPLTRLRMGVDLWLKHPDKAGRDEIVRNLAELDQLVDEILLSSRLDHAGATIGRREWVDLLGLAAEEAARTGAILEGQPVEIMGHETLLRRLCRNLLENGRTHGRPPVRIAVSQQGGEACIAVADAGDGIPPGERERVFEPFYRPAGSAESGGGWGLGLALVRQIAVGHGGRVACEGGPGEGSRFVVHLAIDGPAVGPVAAAEPARRADSRPAPVLQG